ncbi:hypothetical protein [Actinotalea sp. K2]|uniref:hypothetical protein n=1 Tax=Actinotalea sp. K2 TaxID=2939438 RepID=UPI002016E0AA|nr:hypothetical protein [Actinotalea sp. K2]MCL3860990.1 hypothetical protein [Actinotalea sp. K2]
MTHDGTTPHGTTPHGTAPDETTTDSATAAPDEPGTTAGDPPSALELTRRVRTEALLGVIAIAIVVLTALPDLGPLAADPPTSEESVSVPSPAVTTPASVVRPVQSPGSPLRSGLLVQDRCGLDLDEDVRLEEVVHPDQGGRW